MSLIRAAFWRAFATLAVCLGAPAQAAAVDYARDVLPILSEKCYHCHGPDATARQAELRFDRKDGGAFRVVDDVAAIVPGKPDESQLVRRIASDDPDVVMPPAEDIRKLTPKQIETLTKWVEQGADWGD